MIGRFSLEQSKWKWNRKVESCQWTLSVERECCCSICINTIKSEIKFTYKQRRWTMTRMMEKWADKTLQRWWRESYYDSSKQVQVCLFVCCFKLQPEGTFKSRWLLVLVVLVVVTSFKLTWTTRRSPSRSSVRVPLRLVWLGRITWTWSHHSTSSSFIIVLLVINAVTYFEISSTMMQFHWPEIQVKLDGMY